jgi:hypothetical protein
MIRSTANAERSTTPNLSSVNLHRFGHSSVCNHFIELPDADSDVLRCRLSLQSARWQICWKGIVSGHGYGSQIRFTILTRLIIKRSVHQLN